MSEPTLCNGRVVLRALEPTDLDLLYRWENDPRVWTASGTLTPYSRQMLWKYLEEYTGDIYQSHELRLMAVDTVTGEAVGTVDLFHFDPVNNRAELGLLVAPEHRSHGYAGDMLELVSAYARDHLGLRQLYVIVMADNAVCLHLFDRHGWQAGGTLRSWVKRGRGYVDAVVYQRVF